MPTVSYPSAQFPGFPPVHLLRPAGWSAPAAPQETLDDVVIGGAR